jgi:DivIVA domain-containing protein
VSLFLVFFAIALIGVAVLLGTGTASKVFRGRRGPGGEAHDGGPRSLDDGFDDPVANLPPVLLPAGAEPSDIDRLRFAIGLRGYRMDQVDQVLDELRDQLAAKDRNISELEAELERLRAAPERAGE